MVNMAYFRKINPNYMRPRVNELTRPSSLNSVYSLFFSGTKVERVKSNSLDKTSMSKDKLMIYSQTVYD